MLLRNISSILTSCVGYHQKIKMISPPKEHKKTKQSPFNFSLLFIFVMDKYHRPCWYTFRGIISNVTSLFLVTNLLLYYGFYNYNDNPY